MAGRDSKNNQPTPLSLSPSHLLHQNLDFNPAEYSQPNKGKMTLTSQSQEAVSRSPVQVRSQPYSGFVSDEAEEYPFYTKGSKALLRARVEIAKYSIPRVALRLQRAKRKRDDPDEDLDAEIDWALKQAGSLVLDWSEIGDDRPLSGCSFSCDGNMLATCASSRVAKLWSMPQVKKVFGISFSPNGYHLATGGEHNSWRIWDLRKRKSLFGHLEILSLSRHYPVMKDELHHWKLQEYSRLLFLLLVANGQYIATVSSDRTIKHWSSRKSGKEKDMEIDQIDF
ncbi:hypothetical protein RHMOL_Rhmol03G0031400 [Rhododendron molle]|uniref:Uncharacterized protein n=1 Tax=Rhododendron molle TaxID=49168 RepID=A0ACC0PCC9_RHOML|nr:hypothetical protein RHMOL_Rhmol03G0031400 [Rhododendron molle]